MNDRVIGIGNSLRQDDGVGPVVVERLTGRLPEGVVALQHHGEGTSLMEIWRDADRVVLVDATCSGAAPGAIRRWNARATELPTGFFHYSSHLFGVAEAVALAHALNRLPERLIVYGIEGAAFGYGAGLSAPAARAVEEVTARVVEEFRGR